MTTAIVVYSQEWRRRAAVAEEMRLWRVVRGILARLFGLEA